MVNLLGPSLPWRSLKPLTGIRDVPVANWSNRDFCSASQLRMHCKTLLISLMMDPGAADTDGPEIPDDLVLFCIPSVICVLLPVLNVNVCDSADEKFQLPLIKHVDEIRWYQLIEASHKSIELCLDSLLYSPFGDKADAVSG